MIPDKTIERINKALREVGNDSVIRVLPPGHEDIPDTQRTRHPDKAMVKLHTPFADSKQRNAVQKLLADMIVCAEGVMVLPPVLEGVALASNGTAPAVETAPEPVVTATPVETLAFALATPISAPIAPFKDFNQVKRSIENVTLIQTFKVSQPEGARVADGELQKHRNDGWQILNIAAALIDLEYTRVVTLERAA